MIQQPVSTLGSICENRAIALLSQENVLEYLRVADISGAAALQKECIRLLVSDGAFDHSCDGFAFGLRASYRRGDLVGRQLACGCRSACRPSRKIDVVIDRLPGPRSFSAGPWRQTTGPFQIP